MGEDEVVDLYVWLQVRGALHEGVIDPATAAGICSFNVLCSIHAH